MAEATGKAVCRAICRAVWAVTNQATRQVARRATGFGTGQSDAAAEALRNRTSSHNHHVTDEWRRRPSSHSSPDEVLLRARQGPADQGLVQARPRDLDAGLGTVQDRPQVQAPARALGRARVRLGFEVKEEAGKARKYARAFPGTPPGGRPLDAVLRL